MGNPLQDIKGDAGVPGWLLKLLKKVDNGLDRVPCGEKANISVIVLKLGHQGLIKGRITSSTSSI